MELYYSLTLMFYVELFSIGGSFATRWQSNSEIPLVLYRISYVPFLHTKGRTLSGG